MRAPSRRARVRAADAHWLAPSLTFIVVFSYFGLYEVARELEDPYLHPPNELPIVAWQVCPAPPMRHPSRRPARFILRHAHPHARRTSAAWAACIFGPVERRYSTI